MFVFQDSRCPRELSTQTVGGYRCMDVLKEIEKITISSDPWNQLDALCYWGAELIASGHIKNVWNHIIHIFSRYIHINSPILCIYLQKRQHAIHQYVEELQTSQLKRQPINVVDLQLRNVEAVRLFVTEVLTTLSLAPKNILGLPSSPPRITTDDYNTTIVVPQRVFQATGSSALGNVFKQHHDPDCLYSACNEMAYSIACGGAEQYPIAQYWMEWMLEYEAICRKNGDLQRPTSTTSNLSSFVSPSDEIFNMPLDNLAADHKRRKNGEGGGCRGRGGGRGRGTGGGGGGEHEENTTSTTTTWLPCYQRAHYKVPSSANTDVVWLVWDILVARSNLVGGHVQSIVYAAVDLFQFRYTRDVIRKRRNLLYFSLACVMLPLQIPHEMVNHKSYIEESIQKTNNVWNYVQQAAIQRQNQLTDHRLADQYNNSSSRQPVIPIQSSITNTGVTKERKSRGGGVGGSSSGSDNNKVITVTTNTPSSYSSFVNNGGNPYLMG